MKLEKQYCTECRKSQDHREYMEEDTVNYMGMDIDFTDRGYICCVCGESCQSVEQYDACMAEIREEYENRLHKY